MEEIKKEMEEVANTVNTMSANDIDTLIKKLKAKKEEIDEEYDKVEEEYKKTTDPIVKKYKALVKTYDKKIEELTKKYKEERKKITNKMKPYMVELIQSDYQDIKSLLERTELEIYSIIGLLEERKRKLLGRKKKQ
ncbi:MAG: hypothetical protein ACP5RX_03135 [Minisyncoccia bacterium]